MKLKYFSLVFLFFFTAFSFAAESLEVHSVRFQFKPQPKSGVVSGEPFSVVLGVEIPAIAEIQFLNKKGEQVARSLPVTIQVAGLGANVSVWAFDYSNQIRVYRWDGMTPRQLLGNFYGLRLGLGIIRGGKVNAWRSSEGVYALGANFLSGVSANLSVNTLAINQDKKAEAQNPDAREDDWNRKLIYSKK